MQYNLRLSVIQLGFELAFLSLLIGLMFATIPCMVALSASVVALREMNASNSVGLNAIHGRNTLAVWTS